VYVLVGLLLLQGLRLGEALSMPADFLKSERDPRTGQLKWRLSVQTNEVEDDPRAESPALKNEHSIRTIPVATATAQGFLAYLENYRGRVEHGFFLSSTRKLPMSLSGASKSLERLPCPPNSLTSRLSSEALTIHSRHRIRRPKQTQTSHIY
jgi:hypothetical protein